MVLTFLLLAVLVTGVVLLALLLLRVLRGGLDTSRESGSGTGVAPISRRDALLLAGLGLAGTAAGAVGLVLRRPAAVLQPRRGVALTEPDVLSSEDGVLEVTLVASVGRHAVAGRRATTMAYNGSTPGPTLRLRPGDRLRIRLVNELGESTNLHTHGLVVSPEGNADNVFREIAPGESFDYDYRLPDDHPPGVFWYHPHLHHLVADQLFAGLYGAIVVADREELPASRERLLVVADTTLDESGRLVQPSRMERMGGREGQLVLVNGQLLPELGARPGERERWRVVNACTSRFLSLRLDGQDVRLLGRDSGRFAEPQDGTEVLLPPGSRADLLVMLRAGRSVLETMPYDRGGMMMMGRLGSTEPVSLATLEVTGSPVAAPAPLPPPTRPRDLRSVSVARRRALTFAMAMGGPGMAAFTIDGREFDPERIDQEVRLGTVEEWTIYNDSPMDHPFHLHVWPMQVTEVNGRALETPTWQDVVNLPSRGYVKVRMAIETFGGKTVYHCHILDHEDLGMMGTVLAR